MVHIPAYGQMVLVHLLVRLLQTPLPIFNALKVLKKMHQAPVMRSALLVNPFL